VTPAAESSLIRDGRRLAYAVAGQGEPLLLLHAFPLSREMWDPQVQALSGTWRCIALDLPGFGASELGGEVSGMADMAADAVALLDHLGIGRAVVCGLSMGGYVALALAGASPDRLRGLVLADTRAGADAPEARERRLATACEVLEKGSEVLVGAMVPKLLGADTLASRPEVRQWLERRIAAAPPAGVAAAQRGMAARPDRTPELGRIAVPTLILVGEQDVVTPPDESRKMARRIPRADLAVLPGAGHLANREQPEAFNRQLRAFLERLGA
jgi:pimeloyl-ACP methyl ester carboxylesterase